jgi:hypothetical protein
MTMRINDQAIHQAIHRQGWQRLVSAVSGHVRPGLVLLELSHWILSAPYAPVVRRRYCLRRC